jgi:hypothetical protein
MVAFASLGFVPANGSEPLAEDLAAWRYGLENPSLSIFAFELMDLDERTRCGHLRVDTVLRTSIPRPGTYAFCVDPITSRGSELARVLHIGESYLSLDYISEDTEQSGRLRLGPPFLRDSTELRQRVRGQMVVDSPWLGPLLWGSILAAMAAAFLAWTGARLHAWLSLLVALSSVACYALYERLLSSIYDIRVDLFVVWPAVPAVPRSAIKRRSGAATRCALMHRRVTMSPYPVPLPRRCPRRRW